MDLTLGLGHAGAMLRRVNVELPLWIVSAKVKAYQDEALDPLLTLPAPGVLAVGPS